MTTDISSAAEQAPAPRGRNIVTVASGKGGVGKTWLSVTLTHAIAARNRKALLFDGDLGLANVDIQLGIMPKYDLGAVVAGRIDLKTAITKYPEGKFDILAGKSGSGALALLSGPRVSELREDLLDLADQYDRVVVDLGAGVESGVRALVGNNGTILVVTNEEPTAITDAYAFIKVTAMKHPGADLRIVVNQVSGPQDGNRTYGALKKACESFLKISPPLAGMIRRDDKVRDSIRHQTPILLRHPGSKAADDVEALAARLLSEP
jgi:flagellar biosynthesis protein FlhG